MAALKPGDRGVEVRKLQMLLNSKLTPPPRLREDGQFGAKTRDAVVLFQKQNALVPDGLIGPKTWGKLGQRGISPLAPPPAVSAPWMDIARLELGIHEDSLPGNHNARILEYHRTTTLRATTDETPWCSSFVNWVMTRAGYKGTDNALARSWVNWGRAQATPREGAVTVIRRRTAGPDAATGSSTGNHVAFFVSTTPSHIRLLGGNQGDSVKYSNFALSAYDVIAHRWPT